MDNTIIYKVNMIPDVDTILELYKNAGFAKPVTDAYRVSNTYEHSNLVISAWERSRLIGIARSLTDFSFCCYLSDLAVRKEYKDAGIGKKLIELTREKISRRATLLLLSEPASMDYYPTIGFKKIENGFIARLAG